MFGNLQQHLSTQLRDIRAAGTYKSERVIAGPQGALVHAGESITPAGQPRGGDGGSIGDVYVNVHVANGMEWLKDYITVTATSRPVVDAIAFKTGTSASERLRSGRF